MSIKYFCFLFIFYGLTLFSKAQEIGFPIIQNYTSEEYNNAPQVMSAIQDSRGIMYFCVSDGIMEYDGVNWRNIPAEKKAMCYDLTINEEGKIYVAAINEFGYLDTDNIGNTVYRSLTSLISDSTLKLGIVVSVKHTSKFLYFLTYDAILQYNFTSEKFQVFKADTNGRFFGDFVFKDIYYVRLSKKGLMKIEDNELKTAPHSEFFKHKNVFYSATLYNDTTLLIPTRTEGLYLYQPYTDTIPQNFSVADIDFLTDNSIFMTSKFQNEYFILGSFKKGAILIDKHGSILQQYNESNLLQTNKIYEIITDTSQNIWFGLSNGISKTEHSLDLSYWDKNSGIKGNVLSIIRYNNTVYIATSIQVYFIDKKNQVKEVQNIPAGQNWCFLETKISNFLLVGTPGGLYEIKGDKAIKIYKAGSTSVLFQSIKHPNRILSSDGDLFVSYKFENGKWMLEGKWEGIKDDIRGIIEDETGEIWLGTYSNGIIRVTPNFENITKPKNVHYYNNKDGFTSLKDILPFRFKNKILWGSETGLYIYHPQTNRFVPYCELGEQFCNGSRSVYALKEMPDGKIWICPSENKKADIGYLQPNGQGGYDWVYVPFRRIPGMFLNAFYIESSGIVWIGGSKGVYRYDMQKDTKNYKLSFNCLIRKVTAGSDSVIYGGNAIETSISDINYKFNTLKFEFAAPFFDQEERTLYSFKLEGFNKVWSKWSRESMKEYTNLHEGTYIFRVKARNVYDVESETSSYKITILPPFYRTWWAFVIYISMLVLLIFFIVKLYTRYLRKQREQLKQVVEERTIEIINQKEEIESALHSLKDAQGRLIQSEKMASLGILAAGIAHEINNPLNFIHGGVTGINRYFDEHPVEPGSDIEFFIKGISEGIDRAAEIVSGLNHFTRSEDNTSDTIDMHHIIDNCLSMLRFETKNRIEIVKHFTPIPYSLVGNEAGLHQAILNILTNAVQAMDDKGTITIKTEIEGETLRVCFSDTGCGINEKDLPKILDPFFTTKDPGKGTGLGLSITYNIIKAHQGSIQFQSKSGEGTTAILRFPIQKSEKY